MAINLSDNINYNAPKHADRRYGPWTGVTHANDNVAALQRVQGLTVGIVSGGTISEYWYYTGVTNSDLVLKLSGGASGAGTSGTSGSSGTSGIAGTSGSSGSSGTAGSSGTSGSAGTSGTSASGSDIDPVPNSGIEITTGVTGSTIYTIYNTALTPALETPNTVGGIPAGTTVAALTGKTVVDLWNDLLFPTVQPTYTIPTITLGGVGNNTAEVGSAYTPSITLYGDKNDAGIFTQLRILRDGSSIFTDPTLTQSPITAIPDQFGYADPNNPNYRYTISPTPYSEFYTVPLGATTYQGDGNYGAGTAKQDNKGVFDVRSSAVRSVNAPQLGDNNFGSTTYTLTGIYPYFYGDSATLPTVSSIATAIQTGSATKVLFPASGTLSIPYNVTGRYIWVAYMNTYTTKTKWFRTVLDSGDIDNSFITTVATNTVISPELYWSGITFKMHWSVYTTTQTTFEYRNT